MTKIDYPQNKSPLRKYKADYGYWFNKDDITEEEAFLVVQGIEPRYCKEYLENNFVDVPEEYFKFLKKEIKDIRIPNFLMSSDPAYSCRSIQEIYVYLKKLLSDSNVKFENLIELSTILYEKAYTLPEDLIEFLKNKKGIELNYFDKHLDFSKYRLDFEEWFDSKKKMTKEEAVFVALNINPIFAKQIKQIKERISKTFPIIWNSNEELFFYCSYERFLKEKRYYWNAYDMICRFNDIYEEFDFDGNIFTFLNEIYNAGWCFHEDLMEYLESINKIPQYEINSPISGVYKMYSKMLYWTFEEFEMLISGLHPLRKESVLTFLNYCRLNCHFVFQSQLSYNRKTFNILCKHGKVWANIEELFDNYNDIIKKYDEEKKVWKYSSKFLINWVLDNTFIQLPKVMIDCFADDSEIAKKCKIALDSNSSKEIPRNIKSETFKLDLLNYEYDGIDRPEMVLTKIVGDESEIIFNCRANKNRELIRKLFKEEKIRVGENGVSSKEFQSIKAFLTRNSFGDKKKMGQYISKIKTEDFFEITSSSIVLKMRTFIKNIF